MSYPYMHAVPDSWEAGVGDLSVDYEGDVPEAVSGPCPRCHDHLEMSLSDQPAVALAAGGYLKVILRCNCHQPHEGRPPGRRGCGAYGGVRIYL